MDFLTDREISWLSFNERVLEMAEDESLPLLERVRFLTIFSSNLDEFFMKRVGGFKRQEAFGVQAKSSDGKNPTDQLKDIRVEVLQMVKDQGRVFNQVLKPALKSKSIFLLKWKV